MGYVGLVVLVEIKLFFRVLIAYDGEQQIDVGRVQLAVEVEISSQDHKRWCAWIHNG